MLKYLAVVAAFAAFLSLPDRGLAKDFCSVSNLCPAGTRVLATGSFSEPDGTPICPRLGVVENAEDADSERDSCPPPGQGRSACESDARNEFAKTGCYEETNPKNVYVVISSTNVSGIKYLQISPINNRSTTYWADALQFTSEY